MANASGICPKCGGANTTKSTYCRSCIAAYAREKRLLDPEKYAARDRKARIKWLYGLSVEEVDAMLASQGYKCANVGCDQTPETQPKGVLRIDHCHTTGKVRGLLCHQCNAALGLLKDSHDRITGLLAYIGKAG